MTATPFFNPNYFGQEPLGQAGKAMRRFFSGPGLDNYDMALQKDIAIITCSVPG